MIRPCQHHTVSVSTCCGKKAARRAVSLRASVAGGHGARAAGRPWESSRAGTQQGRGRGRWATHGCCSQGGAALCAAGPALHCSDCFRELRMIRRLLGLVA